MWVEMLVHAECTPVEIACECRGVVKECCAFEAVSRKPDRHSTRAPVILDAFGHVAGNAGGVSQISDFAPEIQSGFRFDFRDAEKGEAAAAQSSLLDCVLDLCFFAFPKFLGSSLPGVANLTVGTGGFSHLFAALERLPRAPKQVQHAQTSRARMGISQLGAILVLKGPI